MKRKSSFARISVCIALISSIAYGCKKSTVVSEQTETTIAAAKAELISQFSKEKKDSSFRYLMDVNLPGKGFYSDLDGNKIDRNWIRQNHRGYDCPDPADDYYSQSIISVGSEYSCSVGFRVEVTYEVSVLYNLVLANPSNPTQLSRGRLRLKNSGGSVIYSNTNITPITITNLGADPSDPTLNLFRITFKTDYIDETTFNNSTSAEPSLFCYTDCSNVPSISTGYSPQQAIPTTDVYLVPCERVDKVGFSPTTNAVAGCNAIPSTCYPFGYVFPDRQEIQWLNGSIWGPLKLMFFGTYNTTGLIYTADFWYVDVIANGMSSGSTYQVRYRNRQLTGIGAPCFTDIWVQESWHIL